MRTMYTWQPNFSWVPAHAAGKLAAFKLPLKVVFWPETLPRNANGNILKAELKKIFAG